MIARPLAKILVIVADIQREAVKEIPNEEALKTLSVRLLEQSEILYHRMNNLNG